MPTHLNIDDSTPRHIAAIARLSPDAAYNLRSAIEHYIEEYGYRWMPQAWEAELAALASALPDEYHYHAPSPPPL